MRAWSWVLVVAGCHHTAGGSGPDAAPIPAAAVTCPAVPVGPPCGPADMPCRVATQEPIASPWSSSMSLLLDCNDEPAILYGYSQTSTHGAVGVRGAGGWTNVEMPVDSFLGAGGFDPNGTLHVLAPSPVTGYQLAYLTYAAGAWGGPSVVPGKHGVFRSSLAATADTVYALAPADAGELDLARYDGTWTFTALDQNADTNGTTAIAPSGHPELLYWGTEGTSNWSLVHRPLPDAPETVETITNTLLEEDMMLAVGDGSARVLFDTATLGFESEPGTSELDYATRDSTGTWTVVTVETDFHSPRCFMAAQSGEPCSEHDIVHVPLAVVASSAGDVRLVYRVTDSTYNYVAGPCPGPGEPCQWTVTSSQVTSTLVVAWPTGAGFANATVFTGDVSAAAFDSEGRIQALVRTDPPQYLVLQ